MVHRPNDHTNLICACYFTKIYIHLYQESETRRKIYRNPVIYAQELHVEMVRDNLTRKQLAQRHGVSSDRITQWLCLLKLPEGGLKEVEALGDYWDRQVITERQLRVYRRGSSFSSITPVLDSSEDNLSE